MTRWTLLSAILLCAIVAPTAFAQQTSENTDLLKEALKQYPDADANHDGVLTMQEARDYQKKMQAARRGGKPVDADKAAKPAGGATTKPAADKPILDNEAFKITAAELDKFMQADSAKNSKEPLSFPKGNGLRVLMTGHSWVAPARVSLPNIAKAAGLDGHRQRSHTNGGIKGSANSIFLSEIGKFNGEPANTILLPAISTGQWDVMTWGSYLADKPEYYEQWIDPCLKHNPGMIFYIQDGWPTYQADADKAGAAEAIKAVDGRRAEIGEMYKMLYGSLNAKYANKVHVIPAGDAVVEVLHQYYEKKLPHFDCISEHVGGKKGIYRDGGHLSTNSGMAEIVGYCYYATLYKKSPESVEGYKPANLPKDVDQVLRKAAWHAVTHNQFSGVTDKNENGIADEIEDAAKK